MQNSFQYSAFIAADLPPHPWPAPVNVHYWQLMNELLILPINFEVYNAKLGLDYL